jgi:ABC-type transport system substrate-binding protein
MFAFLGSPEPDTFKYELSSRYIDRDQSVHTAINENYSGIKDPSIDRAFTAASGTFDTRVRARNYDYIQERLAKQSYWISLYFRPQIATADSTVQNFSNNPTQLGPTWNVYAWKTARVA